MDEFAPFRRAVVVIGKVWSASMSDVVFVLVFLAVFALLALVVRGAERL